jgi:ABC-type antimicrobial peptide transport system permease subunit
MRKNVFIKSMMRQPLRTVLLVVLIGLASFAFVFRTAEFLIVRRQIYDTGAHYRTTGFLSHPYLMGDIREGMELLSGHPLIGFEDKRRGAEAFIHGMDNTDIRGMLEQVHGFGSMRNEQPRLNEVFFYAYITGVTGDHESVQLTVRIDEVIVGHPEYIVPGQEMNLLYQVGGENPFGVFDDFIVGIKDLDLPDPHTVVLPRGFFPGEHGFLDIDRYTPPRGFSWNLFTQRLHNMFVFPHDTWYPREIAVFQGLPVYIGLGFIPPEGWKLDGVYLNYTGGGPMDGQRFLFRGFYAQQMPPMGMAAWFQAPFPGPVIPQRWDVTNQDSHNDIWLWPLAEGVWYVPVPSGQSADFTQPGLSHIPTEIETVRRDMRAMQLFATRDMTAMPEVGSFVIHEGRHIDYDDYRNKNQVAVINRFFAESRGISVGDTITLSVPREQDYIGPRVLPGFITPIIRVDRRFPERFEDSVLLNVEVVGITEPDFFTWETAWSLFVFIPESVFPEGVTVYQRLEDGTSIAYGVDHFPDVWYSFVLADSRYERDFTALFRDHLQLMGIELVMRYAEAESFWSAADPILLSITFNAVLFWLVLLLVLLLVAFLFIRQRRRDFAIKRSLGISAGRVYFRLALSAILFGLPAIVLGGFTGRNFAVNEATQTLAAFEAAYQEAVPLTPVEAMWLRFFGELPEPGMFMDDASRRVITLSAEMDYTMLLMLVGIVFGAFIIIIMAGGFATLRLPVLAQLQGGNIRRVRTSTNIQTPAEHTSGDIRFASLTHESHKTKKTETLFNMGRFVRRHVARAPVKSALGFLVAASFILVLGWVQNAIVQTESEIDRLYDTTIVRADVQGNTFGNVARATSERIRESEYHYSSYVEAVFGFGHNRSVLFPQNANREIPDTLNPTVGISDIDTFVARHSLSVNMARIADENNQNAQITAQAEQRALQSVRIDITEEAKFSFDNFSLEQNIPVPVIVSQNTLDERGLVLGDVTEFGVSMFGSSWHRFIDVQIVGLHNGQVYGSTMNDSVIMPIEAFESMMVGIYYVVVDSNIDPRFNRELNHVRQEWEYIVNPPGIDRPPQVLTIYDHELLTAVNAMTQILVLLEMMYPVAVVLAVVIGMGLSFLLMLQNAVNAAILRVLGTSGNKTRLVLWAEPLIVCLTGLAAGMFLLFVTGMGATVLFTLAGLYLLGYAVGSAVGAVIITRKPPLDLLQVKE